jgi:hypothetical protein
MPEASGNGVAFGLPGGGLVSPLPEALRRLGEAARWVVWRWTEPAAPGATPDKPLFRAAHPTRHASTQDPATWGSFAAAMGAVGADEADGAGYVLRDDEHVFLDADNCRDPATGEITPWAERLVEECGSYTEVTPSGRGLRIIGLNESFQAPIHRSVATQALAAVRAHSEAMRRAWTALEAAALEAGHAPLAPEVWETRMPDGSVLAVIRSQQEAHALARDGRERKVWALDEVGRVICAWEGRHWVEAVHTCFPGAQVEAVRLTPRGAEFDWAQGDEVPFGHDTGDTHAHTPVARRRGAR